MVKVQKVVKDRLRMVKVAQVEDAWEGNEEDPNQARVATEDEKTPPELEVDDEEE